MLKTFAHLLVFAVFAGVFFIELVPAGIQLVLESVSLSTIFTQNLKWIGLFAASCAGLWWFARSSARELDFGERNAIDVEAIGLYWHFVDIVWIVIFTAVYLLEYV